jgi:hypothetical protein
LKFSVSISSYLLKDRARSGAKESVQEQSRGEQVGAAARRSVVAQQRHLQQSHRATTRHGCITADRHHRSGPGLGVPQGGTAAAVQQAGVINVGDQGYERVQSGEPLGVPSFARGSQGR